VVVAVVVPAVAVAVVAVPCSNSIGDMALVVVVVAVRSPDTSQTPYGHMESRRTKSPTWSPLKSGLACWWLGNRRRKYLFDSKSSISPPFSERKLKLRCGSVSSKRPPRHGSVQSDGLFFDRWEFDFFWFFLCVATNAQKCKNRTTNMPNTFWA